MTHGNVMALLGINANINNRVHQLLLVKLSKCHIASSYLLHFALVFVFRAMFQFSGSDLH